MLNIFRILLDTFLYAKCYEWVIILGLVLRKFAVLNEIMRLLKLSDLPPALTENIKQGIADLNNWSKNEWYILK